MRRREREGIDSEGSVRKGRCLAVEDVGGRVRCKGGKEEADCWWRELSEEVRR